MSYDLHLLRLSGTADPVTEARALISEEDEEINPGPPVPEKEEKKALAKLLIEENPGIMGRSLNFHILRAERKMSYDFPQKWKCEERPAWPYVPHGPR